MAKQFAKKFYNSKAWEDCREGYIQSVQGLCEKCLKKDIYKPGAIVHHKILLTPSNINDPNITLNWEHLEYQCQDCHNAEHIGKSVVREGLRFNSSGELVEINPK